MNPEPGLAPIGLPEGGQYPDDMFGAQDSANELVIELPDDASSGGLADVALDYGDNSDQPLPPPAEPQQLADISIDPVSAEPLAAEPANEYSISTDDAASGDMFAVNDLMGDEAEISLNDSTSAESSNDLFSVDDLAIEDEVTDATPAPISTPEPLASPEPLATPEPLTTPEPLVAPEPLAAPETLAAPEPVAEFEPLATPEPISTPEPIAAEAPVFEESPIEPTAPAAVDAASPSGSMDFAALDPVTQQQPAFEQPVAEQPAFEQPVTEQPALEQQADTPAAPISDVAKLYSQESQVEPQPPLAGEEISNPYAAVSEEPEVADPAMAAPAETEFTAELSEDETPAIVNPYANQPDEIGVIDPAMALKEHEYEAEESEPDVFVRSESSHFVDAPTEQGYVDYLPADLPQTNRSESIAPPGMENMVVGGLVVADGGRAAKKSALSGSGKGKSRKGKKGKKAKAAQAEAAALAAAAPPAYDPSLYPQQPVDPYAQQPVDPYAQQPVDQYAQQQPAADPYAQQPAYAAAAPVAPQPLPEATGKKGKKAKKQKAPKQGKSTLDKFFGEVPPGEQHKMFGIKFGAPTPMPGQQTPVVADAPQGMTPMANNPLYPAQPTYEAQPQAPVQQPVAQQPMVPMPQPEATGKKAKKAKKQKAPKAPKQGKSTLDKFFGEVPPGEKHKMFGIKFGAPTPFPGQEAPAMPQQAVAPNPQPSIDPYAQQPAADPYAQQPAYAAAPVAPPLPEATGKKAKKAKKQKAPKAPKQGKSPLDKFFGEVPPGEKHKMFGIKFGAPTPFPGQEAPAMSQQAAPIQPVAAPVAVDPYVQAPTAAIPAPPSADDQPGAQIIQSAEAAAHAQGVKPKKQKKAKKQKAPKAPKQGKSTLDKIFGEVPPGEKHKMFGIKFGAPTPIPGQGAPAMPQQQDPNAYAQQAYNPIADAPAPNVAQWPQAPAATHPAVGAPQPPAPPTTFPGGYNADFAQHPDASQQQASAIAGQSVPQQIVPPVEQTAQLQQGQQ